MRVRVFRALLGAVVLIAGCGQSATSRLVEKDGKLFFETSIEELGKGKATFLLSSEGAELGELQIKNGFLIESSYKYTKTQNQGRIKGFGGPEVECIGFDQGSTTSTGKGDKDLYLLCRALENYTRSYRSYSSTRKTPVSISINQVFFIGAAVINEVMYETYYDVKLKK